MKKTIQLLIIILVMTGFSDAQPNRIFNQDSQKVLLEATYFGAGMTSPSGEHLVARIYSDGKVQFENSRIEDGNMKYEIRKTKISKKRLVFLRKLLANENTVNLSNHYKAVFPTIDHTQNLTLKILINNEMKEITVDNFKPNSSRSLKTYPKELLQLACIAESVRKNTENTFFFKNTKSCWE